MDLDPCSICESTPPPPHAVKVRSRGGLGLIEQQSDTNQIGSRGSGSGCICICIFAPAPEPHAAAPAMSPSGEVVASISSALAVLLVLLACVVLGDAVVAIDVYCLIQYDLAGAPLGSRATALNHHAAAFPLPAGADLSRSVIIALLLDLPLSFLREYLAEKKHLGGLLILLPRNISAKNVEGNNDDKGEPKNVLAELEKLLMHEEVPR